MTLPVNRTEESHIQVSSETVKAVLDFAFTKLKITKVVARAIKDNTASIKVIEKLGMKFRNEFVDEKGE